MENLNDIISSLSPSDIDMLKGVAQSILGGEMRKIPIKRKRPVCPPQKTLIL